MRPKVGNSRGMVVKAFAADSDEEEESDEVRQKSRSHVGPVLHRTHSNHVY